MSGKRIYFKSVIAFGGFWDGLEYGSSNCFSCSSDDFIEKAIFLSNDDKLVFIRIDGGKIAFIEGIDKDFIYPYQHSDFDIKSNKFLEEVKRKFFNE